ncbi:hypothetical protein [Pseudomonas xantholysinigenes]|uniref:Uncharacterized protein n=1 Tax=Pseudomonas xantholysinigenes TaxID=2745490 RepID=A0A9E6Q0B6_9PSED|nr:hypothetical protein [Pseudomonas xantholysinigenes]QXI40439.1 hypothetical protein HU772_010345 [Pseudomonas xantholysinigenes]
MATIPIGPGAARVLPEAQQNRVITMDPSLQSRGAQQVADTVQRAALGFLDQRQKEDQALARVKASNALFERETQISTINSDLAEQVRLGTLSHDKLEEAYQGAVAKLEPLQVAGLSEAEVEGMGLAQQRLQLAGQDSVRKLAIGARADAAKGDLATRLDMIGKEAAMPGADIGKLNARLDGEDVDMAGRLAYGEMWPARKQEAKDANWTTQATQRVVQARDGLGSLQQIEHDLTAADGFYAGKLDPEKRNQLLSTVTGRIYQVKEHNQRQAEMREMKAERVLAQMDRQAATGIPPTVADQQRWRSALSGTSMAGEYNTRVQEMNEVQGLLRKPMLDQQQYLDTKRRQLAETGGSVAQINNLNRLQTAVDNNLKLMRDDPLTFNAMRTGQDVEPLDITGIATPEGQARLAEQLGQRYDVVNSVRKAYGPEVARSPWKPGEQAMLAAVINQADDATKLQLFGTLAQSAPTGADYAAAIKPLVADQPVTVLAGLAKFRDLKGADGTDVPKMLLQGQKILADKSVPMPKENLMRAAFDDKVGAALVPGTPQREQAYQGFKALYASTALAAGKAYEEGDNLDRKTTEKAIELVTGGISERAGQKVVKPYGMEDKAFDKAVDTELEGLAKRTEFPLGQLEDMPLSPVPGKEGIYYLLNAGRVQVDPKTNEPMIVRVK